MADYRKIVPFILKWEGGLSGDKRDSTAAAFPLKGTYKGIVDPHTNKGVTYRTFVSLAPKLGYEASAENFIEMPEKIWGKIFKQGFWDEWNLDNCKSQYVADYIVEFAWGFGSGGASQRLKAFLKTKGITTNSKQEIVDNLDALAKKGGLEFFNELVEYKKQMFRNLNNSTYEKGWLNRADNWAEHVGSYAKGSNINWIVIGSVLGVLALTSVVVYKIVKSKSK